MGIVPWHQVLSFEGVTEFIEPMVQCPPGFTDIHQKIFSGGSDPEESGLFLDVPEFFFGCGEGNPGGPGEGGPCGGEEV